MLVLILVPKLEVRTPLLFLYFLTPPSSIKRPTRPKNRKDDKSCSLSPVELQLFPSLEEARVLPFRTYELARAKVNSSLIPSD